MEELIGDAIFHVRNTNKKKVTSSRILQQLNSTSATNWDLETLNDILAVMKQNGVIDNNFYPLNGNFDIVDNID